MKYILIYCYIQNQYALIETEEAFASSDCEVLYEFEADDLKIANKILNSLKVQRMINSGVAA